MYPPLDGQRLIVHVDTRRQILEQIDIIQTLMRLEKANANTHAQRNNYQAVIRVEIETLRAAIERARTHNAVVEKRQDDIPF